jgi:hypothetical protein
VRQEQLSAGIFLVLDIYFDLIAGLEFRVVPEFGERDHTVGFEANVDDDFPVVHGDYGPVDQFMVGDRLQGAVVFVFQSFPLVGGIKFMFLSDGFPVKALVGNRGFPDQFYGFRCGFFGHWFNNGLGRCHLRGFNSAVNRILSGFFRLAVQIHFFRIHSNLIMAVFFTPAGLNM